MPKDPATLPSTHASYPTPSPHTQMSSLSNISSTSPTPASTTMSGGGLRSRLQPNAKTFTPRRVTIKTPSGQEVDLEGWRRQVPAAVLSPVAPSSPAFRLEMQGEKKKRLAGEEAQNINPEGDESFGPSSVLAGAQHLGPVVPLEVSPNRWRPMSLVKKRRPVDSRSPVVVDGKVRALLNKLTMERFDSISDQIIWWANRSEKEKDGRTLIQVIRLVFEKATDEAMWSEMYARLCRKMMEQISPNVHDDGVRKADGKPIAGGQLFHKYLLNRCQEDFERGWVVKEATAAPDATKSSKDQAVKAAAEQNKGEETVPYTEEYYAWQKAGRRGLGLMEFIGELFKFKMLTERIMHECVKKLLANVENPEEEELESLCKLLTTAGQILDTQKARAHMDVYFSRMKELTKSGNLNWRMRHLLLEVIELRERKWIPRHPIVVPTTIAASHGQGKGKEVFTRHISMSRGGPRRGGERGDHVQVGPDGWAVAGGAAARPPPKAGDLSKFGKIDKSAPMTFGPSSVFQKGDKSKNRESVGRQDSVNMFTMLSGNPEVASEVAGKSSRHPPSHNRSSIDLGPGGVPEGAVPPQRKRLQLLPRSVPLEARSESTPAASAVGSEDEDEEDQPSGTPSLSEADAKTRIDGDSKEFFSVRDLAEAEVYFTKLPSEHRHLLVDKLVTKAVESKQADAQLVADLFERAISRNLCSPASFEEGFTPTAEIIDDIAIDAPKAMDLFAIMIKGSHLHLDEERRTRLASKSMDGDKLVALMS
ncbi:hypothetical protein GSI_04144 [Ganoderma sinense ZZ0214-1]|uniref:MI domain-containing protein n=1 Tax=Ganoderma sinense ZZ0214-1 TaxID=1077348 RepID=A0A2G8SID6_9APHY|nr:hypothetical protein GSI_04144 [Ganoderma sinense ZZ0214-1]